MGSRLSLPRCSPAILLFDVITYVIVFLMSPISSFTCGRHCISCRWVSTVFFWQAAFQRMMRGKKGRTNDHCRGYSSTSQRLHWRYCKYIVGDRIEQGYKLERILNDQTVDDHAITNSALLKRLLFLLSVLGYLCQGCL